MLGDLTIIDIVKYAIWVPVAIAFVMAWRKRRNAVPLVAVAEPMQSRRSIEAAWDEFCTGRYADR